MRSPRGLSLIDVVVGSALILVIFVGLFGILRASVQVANFSRAKAAATAVAGSQMEYIRSLSYDSVGTIGGIPEGPVPQVSTSTVAGVEYVTRTLITYIDDPADGLGGADSNGITTDSKLVRIEVAYAIQNQPRDVVLVSRVAPPGIETSAGGGTLRIEVVDMLGAPVPGATVQVVNSAVSPSINISTFSDITGTVLFGGAPTSTEYQVYVSKAGYSSAQTYERDATNANPTPGYLTVAESQTTTGTFAIDTLGTLVISTFSPVINTEFSDTFDTADDVAVLTNTVLDVGDIELSGGAGAYAGSGSVRATTTAPQSLASWGSADFSASVPVDTSLTLHVADENGTLLPDAVLPGNSLGFTSSVALGGISTSTYPALSLIANLGTTDPNTTPALQYWELSYSYGPGPLPDVEVLLTGSKTIGSTSGGASIYKTEVSTTTDAVGVRTSALEWDSYSLSVTGYTIAHTSPLIPVEVFPASTTQISLTLVP